MKGMEATAVSSAPPPTSMLQAPWRLRRRLSRLWGGSHGMSVWEGWERVVCRFEAPTSLQKSARTSDCTRSNTAPKSLGPHRAVKPSREHLSPTAPPHLFPWAPRERNQPSSSMDEGHGEGEWHDDVAVYGFLPVKRKRSRGHDFNFHMSTTHTM